MRDIPALLAIVLIVGFVAVGVPLVADNVHATAEETPPCTPVAHAGALLIMRCELDDGTVLYTNNVGFIVVAE